MKLFLLKGITLFSLVIFNVSAFAETKVAVLSLQQVLKNANFTRQQYKNLNADANFKQLNEQVKSLQDEVKLLRKQGETQSLTWSEAQKQKHLQDGQAKLDKMNQLIAQQRQITNQLDVTIERQLLPKIREIITAIVEKQKIDLLLNDPVILFANEELDITQDVLTQLNNAN